MKARAMTLAVVLFLAAWCMAEPGGGEAPGSNEPAPTPEGNVDLDASFRIPQAKGEGISHTPAVVFTNDGRRMLTATSEGQIVVFDVETRQVRKALRLPGKGTDAVSIDPSGRYAVCSLRAGGVAVMEIESQRIVARDPELSATVLAVSPDAGRIAVARDKTVEIRDLATLKRVGDPIPCEAGVTNLTWSRDGRLLGWTTSGGHVVVREPAKDREVYRTKKGAAQHAIAFSPGGTHLAFGGVDRKVVQVAFATGKEEVISKGQPYWITCLGYSPDGKRLAVGDESCDIWLYQLETKKLTFHNKHHVECWLNGVAWATDNETFIFGCRPNSHAGRPSLHMPLTRAEAARSAAARASRTRLLAAVDAAIGKTGDEKQKEQLRRYRALLAAEERVGAYGGGFGSATAGIGSGSGGSAGVPFTPPTESEGGGEGGGDVDGVPATPAIPLPDLPESLRKLAEAHARTVHDEMKKLRADFCVNRWKVR